MKRENIITAYIKGKPHQNFDVDPLMSPYGIEQRVKSIGDWLHDLGHESVRVTYSVLNSISSTYLELMEYIPSEDHFNAFPYSPYLHGQLYYQSNSQEAYDLILKPVNTKRGAPNGRTNYGSHDNVLGKVYDRKVVLHQGYDKGGAYWGIGKQLRVKFTKDLDYVQFYRR